MKTHASTNRSRIASFLGQTVSVKQLLFSVFVFFGLRYIFNITSCHQQTDSEHSWTLPPQRFDNQPTQLGRKVHLRHVAGGNQALSAVSYEEVLQIQKDYYKKDNEGNSGKLSLRQRILVDRIEELFKRKAPTCPPTGCRCLELGCGPGAVVGALQKLGICSKIAGVDVADVRINFAKQLFPEGTWCAGDATSPKIVNECVGGSKFDIILSVDVYEHILPERYASFWNALTTTSTPESMYYLLVDSPEVLKNHQDKGHLLQPIDEVVDLKILAQMMSQNHLRQIETASIPATKINRLPSGAEYLMVAKM